MNCIFDFDASMTNVKIRLAMKYSPSILRNRINARKYNAFLYILDGSYRYAFSEKEFIAQSHSLIYLPAGSVPYEYFIEKNNGKAESMQIEFEIIDVKNELPLSFTKEPVILTDFASYPIKSEIEEIIHAYRHSASKEQYLAFSRLYSIFSYFGNADMSLQKSKAAMSVQPALSFLEHNPSENPSSAYLAALCSLSVSQFRRNVKSATGKTPSEYRKHLTLKNAKQMLLLGTFQIGEIADMLGFCDVYAFSHFFRNETGISPTKFISMNKK